MGSRYQGKPHEMRALDAYIKLLRATRTVSARLDKALAGDGLTETQLGVLEALLHLGALCQRELGQKLCTSGANMTSVVDNLERRELVRRVRDAEDRRYVSVHLTSGGKSLIERVFPRHVAGIVEALSALSPEEQRLLDSLCKKLGTSSEVAA